MLKIQPDYAVRSMFGTWPIRAMASSINCCSANLRVSGNRGELDRLDGDGNVACAGVNVHSAPVRTAKGGGHAGEDRHRDASHQRDTDSRHEWLGQQARG